MKKEIISDALNHLDDSFIKEAAMLSVSSKSRGKEQKKTMSGRKIIKMALLTAVLMSLLAVSAFAVGKYINSPEQAIKVAQQELKKMQEMGLVAEGFSIDDEPAFIAEFEEENSTIFIGRLLKHRYIVRDDSGKYQAELTVDTSTGKATRVNLEAYGDENDEIVGELDLGDVTLYYYNNFDDVFNPNMTIDEFCTLLAEYWGFSGYTLSGTVDNFYQYDTPAPSGDTLLKDICDEAYLTVYFEGDQSGAPMFVEVCNFPQNIYLGFGTGHLVG